MKLSQSFEKLFEKAIAVAECKTRKLGVLDRKYYSENFKIETIYNADEINCWEISVIYKNMAYSPVLLKGTGETIRKAIKKAMNSDQ